MRAYARNCAGGRQIASEGARSGVRESDGRNMWPIRVCEFSVRDGTIAGAGL